MERGKKVDRMMFLFLKMFRVEQPKKINVSLRAGQKEYINETETETMREN